MSQQVISKRYLVVGERNIKPGDDVTGLFEGSDLLRKIAGGQVRYAIPEPVSAPQTDSDAELAAKMIAAALTDGFSLDQSGQLVDKNLPIVDLLDVPAIELPVIERKHKKENTVAGILAAQGSKDGVYDKVSS